MLKIKTIIIILFFVLACNSVHARIFFVDKSNNIASDKNPGTENMPWKTISHAARIVKPGDIVMIKAGEYIESDFHTPDLTSTIGCEPGTIGIYINVSGTFSRPIKFMAYPGDRVVIKAKKLPLLIRHANNIIINGLIFESLHMDHGDAAVVMLEANNCIINKCEIIGHFINTNDNHPGIYLKHCKNITISNCKIHGTQGLSHNSAGYLSYFTSNVTIKNCYIYNCTVGIFFKANNYNFKIYKNIIRNCKNHAIFLCSRDTQYHAEISPYWDGKEETLYTRIYQNIIANCASGIYLLAMSHTGKYISDWRNTLIWNNVFSYLKTGISVTGAPNLQIWNNIFYWVNVIFVGAHRKTIGPDIYIPRYSDHNCFFPSGKWILSPYRKDKKEYNRLINWQYAQNLDLDSFVSNPNFKDLSSFHLSKHSPCINAGIDRQDYNHDGNSTEAIPLGCYISKDDIIGPSI